MPMTKVSAAQAVAAGAGASQAHVARRARRAYALRCEGRDAGAAGEVDGDGADEDAWEGAISGASGGVVVDETDGMNAPQAVGDGRMMRWAVEGLPVGSRPADILIHFAGNLIHLEVDATMRPVSPRIGDNPGR